MMNHGLAMALLTPGFPDALLGLTDAQLQIVLAAARPLQRADQAGFFKAVSLRLAAEPEVGDGCVPWKGGALQWVRDPPGNRSSRKQPEQDGSWRSGRKLTDRTPSDECSYRRPTANSGSRLHDSRNAGAGSDL
jgi:hypothetical protein